MQIILDNQRLILGFIMLIFTGIIALKNHKRVNPTAYWLTIAGLLLLAMASFMIAGVHSLRLAGCRTLSHDLLYCGLVVFITGVALLFAALSKGAIPWLSIEDQNAHEIRIHRKLAIVYLIIILIVLITIQYTFFRWIDVSYSSVSRMLNFNSGIFSLYTIGMFLIAACLSLLLRQLGLIERFTKSKWAMIAPFIVFAIIAVAFQIPVWFKIQSLIHTGVIWHSDARAFYIFAADKVFFFTFVNAFGWHTLLGSGVLYRPLKQRQSITVDNYNG